MADIMLELQTRHTRSPESADMIWVPGGTFRMGSDRHYPEEAPTHRVTVHGFWMDRHPVTNKQFREFVRATKHVTLPRSRLIRIIREYCRT